MNPELYFLRDDGIFPNSRFPAVCYKNAVRIPAVFPYARLKRRIMSNGWGNCWKYGIYTYHHYHSTTHEVLIALSGSAVIQLGGENGETLEFSKGDVLFIPAGVAHKNLSDQDDIICLGAYPNGDLYDVKYGKPGERPAADIVIQTLGIPATDPFSGKNTRIVEIWNAKI